MAVQIVDDVLTALLSIFTTAAGTSAAVYDALPVNGGDATSFVLVGDDGDPTTDSTSGVVAGALTQERMGERDGRMDGRTTEVGDITCAVACQTGADDLPAMRVASRTLMAALEAAIRADRTLGGVVIRSNVDDVTVWQGRNQGGSFVRRVFTVHYEANQG